MSEEAITAQALGRKGEEIALEYLRKKKYRIVERNFRLSRGEIDIIAYDGTTLVFCEVKARASYEFGLPEESVTPAKQKQIMKIARGFIAERGLGDPDCRFDVISIMFSGGEEWTFTHYQDAFS
jgi:putative endonuclease